MAGYIKGISIEFSANTEKLNGALKKTQGTLNKTQAELKAVNRSLKFNPGNATLLRQKFELLQRTVTETRQKINDLRKLQNDMRAAGVKKSSTQWKQLEREIIKTENQLKMAEADLKRFGSVGKQQALAVGAAFKTAGSKIKSAGRTITTTFSVYGMAGIYAGSKLIAMSQKQALAEQKLTTVYKQRMGATKGAAKATMELASAIQKQGVIGDEVTLAGAQELAVYAKYPSTINKILPLMDDWLAQEKGMDATQEDAVAKAKLLGKALNGNAGALTRLGVKLTDAQKRILQTGTEEQKAAVITDVLSKKYGGMNAELAKTDAGKIQQAKNDLGDMGEEIGAVLLPAVADLVGWMRDNLLPKIQQFIDFMKQHPAIAKFALAFALVTAALGPVLILVGSLVSTIGSLITIASTLGISLGALAAPIGIAVAAIAGIIAVGVLLYKNWDTIKAKATAAWNKIKSTVTTAVKAIKTTVTSTFNTLKNTVTNTWNGIKNAITHPIETAKSALKKIVEKIKGFFPINLGKIVSFMLPTIGIGKLFKKIGGKTVSAPKFAVSGWTAHASGGIFPRPTLLQSRGGAGHVVGEAGAEAIIPLSELWSHMNALGDSIVNGVIQAGAMGGNGGQANITLYAFPNGPQMGSWVVNTYDTYKRRLG